MCCCCGTGPGLALPCVSCGRCTPAAAWTIQAEPASGWEAPASRSLQCCLAPRSNKPRRLRPHLHAAAGLLALGDLHNVSTQQAPATTRSAQPNAAPASAAVQDQTAQQQQQQQQQQQDKQQQGKQQQGKRATRRAGQPQPLDPAAAAAAVAASVAGLDMPDLELAAELAQVVGSQGCKGDAGRVWWMLDAVQSGHALLDAQLIPSGAGPLLDTQPVTFPLPAAV